MYLHTHRAFTYLTIVTNLCYLTVGDVCVPDNCLSVHCRPLLCIPAVLFSAVCSATFSFGCDIPIFFGSAMLSTRDTLSLLGVGSSFFVNETSVVYMPLIWDTAFSEILDEGDSESEADQEAGSSEEDEDDDDEEEDEDGKHMAGTLLVMDLAVGETGKKSLTCYTFCETKNVQIVRDIFILNYSQI